MKNTRLVCGAFLFCTLSTTTFAQLGWQQKGATSDLETTPATNDVYVNHDLHVAGKTQIGNVVLDPANGAVTSLRFNSADYVEMYSKSSGSGGPSLLMFNNVCPSLPASAGNLELWTNGATRMKIDKNGVVNFGDVSLNPYNGNIRTLRFSTQNTGGYTEMYSQNDGSRGSAIIMGSSAAPVAGHGGIAFWAYNDVHYTPSNPDRAYEFLINNYDNTRIPPSLDQRAAMVIHKDGKVMIGDALNFNSLSNAYLRPAGYKLIVQEGILTEKLKVASSADYLNWSDFVFADDYQLMPLPELESYIAQHKHLPEIPSAEEVSKEGIDVAAMDARLLQKIEELTIYVIRQQKKIELLEKQIKKQ